MVTFADRCYADKRFADRCFPDTCVADSYITGKSPEVSPVLPNIPGVIADCLATVFLHELWSITLDKVEPPALETNVILEPVHPVNQAGPQQFIGMVQVCTFKRAITPDTVMY